MTRQAERLECAASGPAHVDGSRNSSSTTSVALHGEVARHRRGSTAPGRDRPPAPRTVAVGPRPRSRVAPVGRSSHRRRPMRESRRLVLGAAHRQADRASRRARRSSAAARSTSGARRSRRPRRPAPHALTGGCAAASSASTRWMAVSWACRRAHMARGEGAGRKVQHSGRGVRRPVHRPAGCSPRAASRPARRRRARCRRRRRARRPTAPCAPRRRSRWPSGARRPCAARGPAPSTPGRSAPRPSGSGRVGGHRHQLALMAQRLDVRGDLHRRRAAQVTLSRSMTKTSVSLAAMPGPGDWSP